MFKSVDLLHFFANRRLVSKNAILKLKMNVEACKSRNFELASQHSQALLDPLKKESHQAIKRNEALAAENQQLQRINRSLREENELMAEQRKREAEEAERRLQSSSSMMLERLESEKLLIESQYKNENQQLQLRLKTETQDLLLKNNEERYLKERMKKENENLKAKMEALQAENEKLKSINKELLGIINSYRNKQETAKAAGCQTEEWKEEKAANDLDEDEQERNGGALAQFSNPADRDSKPGAPEDK